MNPGPLLTATTLATAGLLLTGATPATATSVSASNTSTGSNSRTEVAEPGTTVVSALASAAEGSTTLDGAAHSIGVATSSKVMASIVTAPVALTNSGAATSGSATVTVSPNSGDPDYATEVSLKGSGFQPVAKGFGGVYVLFGTVSGTWQPSQGGTSGVDYLYVPDAEEKDNKGFQRFVSFEGGSSESSANGGTLASDGTWSTKLIIPGATFTAGGRNGEAVTVNCLKVQCGVITIGAHGVVNAQNETFTPVTFAVPTEQATADSSAAGGAAGAGTDSAGQSSAADGSGGSAAGQADGTSANGVLNSSPASGGAFDDLTGWIIGGAGSFAAIMLFSGWTSVRRARKKAGSQTRPKATA